MRRLYADTAFASTQPDHFEPEALIGELRQIRDPGYAPTWGDRELGLAAVAVVQRSRALRATTEQAAGQLL